MRYHVWRDLLGNPYIKNKDKPKQPMGVFKLPTDHREIPTTDISLTDGEIEALQKITF